MFSLFFTSNYTPFDCIYLESSCFANNTTIWLQFFFVIGVLAGISLVLAAFRLHHQRPAGDQLVLVYIGALITLVCALLLSIQCSVEREVKRKKRKRRIAISLAKNNRNRAQASLRTIEPDQNVYTEMAVVTPVAHTAVPMAAFCQMPLIDEDYHYTTQHSIRLACNFNFATVRDFFHTVSWFVSFLRCILVTMATWTGVRTEYLGGEDMKIEVSLKLKMLSNFDVEFFSSCYTIFITLFIFSDITTQAVLWSASPLPCSLLTQVPCAGILLAQILLHLLRFLLKRRYCKLLAMFLVSTMDYLRR